MSLDTKWARYQGGYGLEPGSKPTNLAERWYNPADELTVAVMLKHPGPKQESFRDCAFDNGVALSVRHIFACSGLRTANGQTRAVIAVWETITSTRRLESACRSQGS